MHMRFNDNTEVDIHHNTFCKSSIRFCATRINTGRRSFTAHVILIECRKKTPTHTHTNTPRVTTRNSIRWNACGTIPGMRWKLAPTIQITWSLYNVMHIKHIEVASSHREQALYERCWFYCLFFGKHWKATTDQCVHVGGICGLMMNWKITMWVYLRVGFESADFDENFWMVYRFGTSIICW